MTRTLSQKMKITLIAQTILAQVDQGWRERDYPSDDGGSFGSGLILLAILGIFVAWLRGKSEDKAQSILAIGVIAGSIWAAVEEGSWIWFIFGLVGFGTLATFIWLASGFFHSHD